MYFSLMKHFTFDIYPKIKFWSKNCKRNWNVKRNSPRVKIMTRASIGFSLKTKELFFISSQTFVAKNAGGSTFFSVQIISKLPTARTIFVILPYHLSQI